MSCSESNLPNQHPTPSLPSWWSHSFSTYSFEVPEETVDEEGRLIAHLGCVARFRCFSPAPLATQEKFGVSALIPTPGLALPPGSAPASVRGAERCPKAPLPGPPCGGPTPLSAHNWTIGSDGPKLCIVHRFRRRYLSSLSFQLAVSKPSCGKKEAWPVPEMAMACSEKGSPHFNCSC